MHPQIITMPRVRSLKFKALIQVETNKTLLYQL